MNIRNGASESLLLLLLLLCGWNRRVCFFIYFFECICLKHCIHSYKLKLEWRKHQMSERDEKAYHRWYCLVWRIGNICVKVWIDGWMVRCMCVCFGIFLVGLLLNLRALACAGAVVYARALAHTRSRGTISYVVYSAHAHSGTHSIRFMWLLCLVQLNTCACAHGALFSLFPFHSRALFLTRSIAHGFRSPSPATSSIAM